MRNYFSEREIEEIVDLLTPEWEDCSQNDSILEDEISQHNVSFDQDDEIVKNHFDSHTVHEILPIKNDFCYDVFFCRKFYSWISLNLLRLCSLFMWGCHTSRLTQCNKIKAIALY